MTTKLSKEQQGIIAAHEAGMHDRKPQPATCKGCAQDASAQRAFGDLLVITPPKRRVVRKKVSLPPATPEDADLPAWDTPAVPVDPKPAPEPLPTVRVTIEKTPAGLKAVDVQPVYTSRESWLMAATDELAPLFAEAGSPLAPVRVSVGWPAGRSAKANTIGQCFQGVLVADSVPAIFISPVLTDPVEVLSTLVHELVHSVVPVSSKPHVGAFVKLAKAVGLTGKWTSTVAGPELKERLTALAETLGVYTHSKVTKSVTGGRKVQTTRMLKVTCGDCGCVIRMTKKWLDEVGAPTCACDGEMREAE